MGEEDALALHRALLEDSLGLLRSAAERSRAEPIFAPSEPWDPALAIDEPDVARAAAGIRLLPQYGSDLGERLLGTFRTLFGSGAPAAVVIGSDSPTLPEDRIREAFASLRGAAEMVLGPAEDGGYYLIGAKRLQPRIFTGIPWGSSAVLAETVAAMSRTGLEAALLPPWYDIDRPEDLPRLRRDLDRAAGSGAGRTRSCLERLSGRLPF